MLESFAILFSPQPLLLLTLGVVLGIVIGAIPGLTATMLIALTLPFTFYMNSVDAITLLGIEPKPIERSWRRYE